MIPTFRLFGYFCIGLAVAAIFSHSAALSKDFIPIGFFFLCFVAVFSLLIGLGAYFLRENLGAELYITYLFMTACLTALVFGGALFWY